MFGMFPRTNYKIKKNLSKTLCRLTSSCMIIIIEKHLLNIYYMTGTGNIFCKYFLNKYWILTTNPLSKYSLFTWYSAIYVFVLIGPLQDYRTARYQYLFVFLSFCWECYFSQEKKKKQPCWLPTKGYVDKSIS